MILLEILAGIAITAAAINRTIKDIKKEVDADQDNNLEASN
jgi:hypothetical protein